MTMTYVEIRVRLQMTSIFSPFLVTLCSGGVLWVSSLSASKVESSRPLIFATRPAR